MARTAYAVTVGAASRSANARVTASGPADDPFSGSLWAAVDAAVTVLVADAASPTQAHVTTLAAAWAAFVASSNDMVLLVDTTKTTEQKLMGIRELRRIVVPA